MSPLLDASTLNGLANGWAALALDILWKGSLLLALAGAGGALLSRASASSRHLVWQAAVVGVLALPLLAGLLPAWELAVLPAVDEPVESTTITTLATVEPAVHRAEPRTELLSTANSFVPATVRLTASTPEPVSAPGFLAQLRQQATQWHATVWLLLVWELGAVVGLLLLALGTIRLSRLARQASPLTHPLWMREVDRHRSTLGIGMPVRLLLSREAHTPMTWGLRRPVVLLPSDALGWDEGRRHDVLLHELAHVKRRDILGQLAARIACALFWFHPLVWFAAKRMRLEGERACDDRVLMAGSRASSYAGHLLEMARSLRGGTRRAMPSVAMARRSQLGLRMQSLLEPQRSRRAAGRRFALITLGLALLVLLPLSALRPTPQLQAAEPDPPRRTRVRPPAPAVAPVPDVPSVPGVPSVGGVPSVAPVPSPPLARLAQRISGRFAPLAALRRGDRTFVNGTVGRDGELLAGTAIHSGGQITWIDDDDHRKLQVELEGEIEFSADEDDIVWMGDDAYFEIEEKRGRDRRRVVVEPDGDELERRWYEGRKRVDWNDEAQAWLGERLGEFLANSAYNAPARVERLYREGGVDRVLEAIEEIDSDYARARHFGALVDMDELSAEERRRVLTAIPEQVESDYERANLLLALDEEYREDPELRTIYLEAAGDLDSDYEKSRVLQGVLAEDDLDEGELMSLLGTLDEIDSDYERAEILTRIRPQALRLAGVRDVYLAQVLELDSDYERSRSLHAILDTDDLDDDTVVLVLEGADGIDSDYETSQLLQELVPRVIHLPRGRERLLRSVDEIDSDYERSQLLQTLLKHADGDEEVLVEILAQAEDLDSDYERVNVLVNVLDEAEGSEAVREAALRVADQLDGDYEYGQAMRAIRRYERKRL